MYATQQDLVERYGEAELTHLADRDGDGEPEAAVVAQALGDAAETIDAYLGKRYALPLPSLPPVLTRVAATIARYLLHKEGAPEQVQADHKWALGFLADLASGKATLGLPGAEPAGAGGTVQHQVPARVFGRDGLEGF